MSINRTIFSAIALIFISIFGGMAAHAEATCFCKVSTHDLTNKKTATGVVRDLTANLGTVYKGPGQQGDANQTACNTACTNLCAGLTGDASLAAAACSAGAANGTALRCWSAVGTREYKTAQAIGTIKKTPEVAEYKCPAGWLANDTNEDGGITKEGKCKKLSGKMTITQFPANGTQIGSYGFTWGDGVWAWGTTANGGAPVKRVIQAAYCGF